MNLGKVHHGDVKVGLTQQLNELAKIKTEEFLLFAQIETFTLVLWEMAEFLHLDERRQYKGYVLCDFEYPCFPIHPPDDEELSPVLPIDSDPVHPH